MCGGGGAHHQSSLQHMVPVDALEPLVVLDIFRTMLQKDQEKVTFMHMPRPPQPHPPSLLQRVWFGRLLVASLLDPCGEGGREGEGRRV